MLRTRGRRPPSALTRRVGAPAKVMNGGKPPEEGDRHAARDDRPGPDGREHGAPADARRPRVRRLRRPPRRGAGAGREARWSAASLDEFVEKLDEAAAVWLMVPAAVVDATLEDAPAPLETGDIVIDGGNSYYIDDIRRAAASCRPRASTTSTSAPAAASGGWSAATA